MDKIKQTVNKYLKTMVDADKYIWENPEVGYKEFKTNEYMLKEFEKLGYKTYRPTNITGFTCYFDTGKKGPTVLIIAELDGLYCATHPERDMKTNAVHSCGHNTQCATILGVAGAIREKAINENLCGKVKFCIVPAEEGIEIEYRNGLIEKGIITFASGKPEFIKRGLLDDVDLAFMMHIADLTEYDGDYWFIAGHNGLIRKQIEIQGKAAHAGGEPWDGINALYAADLALSACNALRETFKDEDKIRFHPIITKGGDSVNSIPDSVVIESFLRGANIDAIKQANFRINRAITGACLAMGAKVKIIDSPGYDVHKDDVNFTKLIKEQCAKIVDKERVIDLQKWWTSSTDFGDISGLVPTVLMYVDGARGIMHGNTYYEDNRERTCYLTACAEVATIVELLKDNGKKAYDIMAKYKPVYSSIEEYLKTQEGFIKTYDCISYEGEKATVKFN